MAETSGTDHAVEVYVEPSAQIPDGASLRYKAAGPEREVVAIHYESDDGDEGVWDVDSPGSDAPIRAVPVHDSSAGVSWLVWGGVGGLRLRLRGTEAVSFEPFVLLADESALIGGER